MQELQTDEGVKYLEMTYEPENGWIRCKWFGDVPVSYISKGIDCYQQLLKETHCTKLLNDNSRFKANWIELNDRIENERMAESVKNGLRYMAHVNASRFITRFSAVDLGTRVKDFEFKIFEELEDAEDWLRNV